LDFRRTETLGMQIVVTLVDQIDGTIEMGASGGTDFQIRFKEIPCKPSL
jgi:two-component sensor histidine kinase